MSASLTSVETTTSIEILYEQTTANIDVMLTEPTVSSMVEFLPNSVADTNNKEQEKPKDILKSHPDDPSEHENLITSTAKDLEPTTESIFEESTSELPETTETELNEDVSTILPTDFSSTQKFSDGIELYSGSTEKFPATTEPSISYNGTMLDISRNLTFKCKV